MNAQCMGHVLCITTAANVHVFIIVPHYVVIPGNGGSFVPSFLLDRGSCPIEIHLWNFFLVDRGSCASSFVMEAPLSLDFGSSCWCCDCVGLPTWPINKSAWFCDLVNQSTSCVCVCLLVWLSSSSWRDARPHSVGDRTPAIQRRAVPLYRYIISGGRPWAAFAYLDHTCPSACLSQYCLALGRAQQRMGTAQAHHDLPDKFIQWYLKSLR